jgi:hypothetical protein
MDAYSGSDSNLNCEGLHTGIFLGVNFAFRVNKHSLFLIILAGLKALCLMCAHVS